MDESTRRADDIPSESRCKLVPRLCAVKSASDSSVNGVSPTVEPVTVLKKQPFPDGHYLGGGTALALHLGHRRPVDLDWFTTERLGDPLRLAQDLRNDGIAFV